MSQLTYALSSLGAFALFAGVVLAIAQKAFHVEGNPMVDNIDALLPQTQCGQCGHPGCKQYAEAVVSGAAEINKCVPGGERIMLQIAELMGVEPETVEEGAPEPSLAYIREGECIGCMLCIKACPVDGIVGGPKQYHTIITGYCTGCGLCAVPCPVDCIEMQVKPKLIEHWSWPLPDTRKAHSDQERRERHAGYT